MSTTSTLVITNKTEENTDISLPVELDNSYKGDEVGKQCCEILELPEIRGWSVVDTTEHLALLHYTEDSDKALYGHIRGLLVDLESKSIIADSFGYTPTLVAQNIKPANDALVFHDSDGVTHSFPIKDVIIKRVFEGVVIRVIWRKGKMYKITHRKINTVKSRWGSSKTFLTMYEEAGGPTAEQLFDTSVPNSSTCYDFLVVDRSLLVATRQIVSSPYLVFISKREMKLNRPAEEIAQGIATFTVTPEIKGSASGPFIHDPQNLSIDEANLHLTFGYYNQFNPYDIRQLTGEAIIIYKMENGKISDSVKIYSPAYEWRSTMRGNNPNINNRFYNLLSIAYPEVKTSESWNTFKQKLMLFSPYSEESLRQLLKRSGCIFNIPIAFLNNIDLFEREDRIYLLWINYVLSLPIHAQEEGLDILSNFKKDRNELILWIQKLEEENKNIENTTLISRLKSIITSSRRLSTTKQNNPSSYLIKSTIRNLINKEAGPSLYGLVREMKMAKKLKLEEETKSLENSRELPGKTLEEIEINVMKDSSPEVTDDKDITVNSTDEVKDSTNVLDSVSKELASTVSIPVEQVQ